MIIRLDILQVAALWNDLAPGIEASLPPNATKSPETMIRILEALYNDEAHCWVDVDPEDESLNGFAITTFLRDPVLRTWDMLIYAVYAFDKLSRDIWLTGIDAMREFAKVRGANTLLAYTPHPGVARNAQRTGADISYQIIAWPLQNKEEEPWADQAELLVSAST